MASDDGLQGAVDTAANNALLALAARVLSILTPMLLVPLLVWLFSTVSDVQLSVVKQGEHIDAIEHRVTSAEATTKEISTRNAMIDEQNRKDWIDIRERMTRVETQNQIVIDTLKHISELLDAQRKGR